MNEIWRPIDGYEDLYFISNTGRVCGPKGILTPYTNGSGYLKIRLWRTGKHRAFYVHRLVASAFCIHEAGRDVVNHLDFDRANNRADNLEWCTATENARHSAPHHRKPKSVTHTNTGERYINYRKERNYYRVTIRGREIGRYTTLDLAIRARERALRG